MKKLVCKTLLVVMCISLLVLTFALGACDTDGEATLTVGLGEYVIYVDDDLSTLKNYLTVTYTDAQGNSRRVTDYDLSGTLHEGTCEITVTYSGISTTVRLNVSVPDQAISVNFYVDGELWHEATVKSNGINFPKSPSKIGFEFVGWCYDVDGNEPFDASRPIEDDVVLYAKWEEQTVEYTVTFIVDGQEFYSYTAEAGSQIDVPMQEPSAICKAFVGWLSADNEPMDAQQTVDSDLTFYASFETSHFWVMTDYAVPATCTESGLTEGSHCASCGEVLVAQQEVPALDHDLQQYAAKAPTCTKDGWEAFEKCQRDGCDYTTFREIESDGHKYGNFIKEVAATCEDDGVKGHYHCSVCEKDFDRYYDELTDLKIDALGHDIEHHEAQAPSCAYVGWDAYDACKREGCTYTTYQEIAKLEHDMDEDEKCKNCGYFDSGLELELSSDEYIVVGLGTFTGTDVVIPAANADGKPVTAIADNAFKNTNITSITIPASVKEMGWYAFDGCDSLAKVNYLGTIDQWAQIKFWTNLSNPLYYANNLYVNDELVTEVKLTATTEIGAAIFYNCTSITSVEIPSGVTKIGSGAFNGCTNLKSITIPESVKVIDNSAFEGCKSLESITIPAGVTAIGNDAFHDCENIAKVNYLGTIDQWVQVIFANTQANPTYWAKNLYLSDEFVTEAKLTTATKISSYAFYNCASLASIEVPASVTGIGSEAFYGCTSLTGIKIPESVTSISKQLFYGCTSLASIEIPAGVTVIALGAFKYCTSLEKVNYLGTIDQWAQITFASSFDSTDANPLCNGGKLYFNDELLTEAKLSTATEISEYAFYNCTSLEKLEIPASVTKIGRVAFYDCINLKTVTFAENSQLASIGSYAFEGCTSLVSIEIPASVASIGDNAFARCDNLTSVTFAENSQLSSIEGFISCSSLTSIAIPAGVTKIEGSTFANCSSLASITIPASVTEMGYDAFYGCSLAKVNYLGTIDQWAQITFGGSVSNPLNGNALLYINNTPATDVKLTATEISSRAFYAYGGLVSVDLSSSVTSIGKEAFSNCENLISVTIPASVTTIGDFAFYKSNALTIYCEVESKPDGWPSDLNRSYIGTVSSYTLPVVWNCKTNEVAYDGYTYAVIDGIRYALKDSEAMVDFQPKNIASELVIPSSVTYKGVNYVVTGIAYYAFYIKGNDLVSVTIPSSVTSVGSYAFYGCNRVTIYCEVASQPSGWNGIDWSYRRPVVWDCKNKEVATDKNIYATIDGIRYALNEEVASVTCQLNNSASVKIPSFVIYKDKSYSVTNIADNAFYGCSSLTSIEIPASITKIGSYAFSGCSSLTKVNYLGTIDQWAEIDFADKSANPWWIAKNLYINDQLVADVKLTSATIIEGYAFYGCSAVTNIIIPASVTKIYGYAFADCQNLVSVVISDGVEYIGGHAFTRCANLESITIPASVTFMGWNAFSGCNSLAKVNYLGTIDQWVQIEFNEDTSSNPLYGGGDLYINDVLVTEVKLTTATKIGDFAFSNCKSLTSIEIAASVTSIGESAFEYCSNLTSVTFEAGSVLGSIGDSAFADCSKLASITIPANVTSIGSYAFYRCGGLTSITIPASVTKIGAGAFRNCSNLTIYCEAESQPSGWSSDWNRSNCTVVWNCKNSETAGEEDA